MAAVRRPATAFAVLAAVQVVLIAAITVITIALPAIQREFGLTAARLALLTSAYGLSFAGLLLLGGRLADMAGRRRVFVIGVAVFGLASVGAALASGYASMVAARFAQGCGAALAAPAAIALLGDVFPVPRRRTQVLAVWGGLSGIGATAGTLLSGLVTTWASWRWAFVVPAAIATGAVLLAPRLLPPAPAAPPRGRERLDLPGAVLATAGLSALSYATLQGGEEGWASTTTVGSSSIAVAALVAFVAVERRTPQPLLPLGFLASARRVAGLVTILVTAACMATTWFLLSLFLQDVRGYSPLVTAAAALPYAVVQVGTGVLAGRLVGRFGVRAVAVAGAGAAATGLALLARLDPQAPYVGTFLGGLLAFGAGASLAFGAAMVAAVDRTPGDQAGLAGGLANMAMETGPTVGFAVLVSLAVAHTGALAATGVSERAAMAAGSAYALGAAALTLALTAVLAGFALRECQPDRARANHLGGTCQTARRTCQPARQDRQPAQLTCQPDGGDACPPDSQTR